MLTAELTEYAKKIFVESGPIFQRQGKIAFILLLCALGVFCG